MSIPISHVPLSPPRQRKTKQQMIVHANAPQPDHEPEPEPELTPAPQDKERPYLLKKLQHGLGTRVLGDTLDWDALAHYTLDASMLSLDNVYKGLKGDLETYYFLWVAVRKVLAEAPNVKFSGARVRADQKTQFLNELLDAALEQFLAELGDALMNFVKGPHCTIVDPRNDGDPDALQAKARSLITRFEKLGRSRDMLMVAIPATESGIEAAGRLQREDGINVNLTFVSGVMHATACAQSGAVAVTLPIAKMQDWRQRGIGRNVGDSEEDVVGAGAEDAETIAAYFELHGLSSSTGLIAGKMNHVDDACPLAALAALSFDANQLQKAEWHTAYPPVPLALPDRAQRRASALSPPPPPDPDRPAVKTMRKLMNAQAFSAFAAITYGAVGNGRAAMSMIADVARAEIDWQLLLRQPLSSLNAVAIAAAFSPSARRSRRPGSGLTLSIPAPVRPGAKAGVVPPAASGRRDPFLPSLPFPLPLLGKRRRSLTPELAEGAPDSPRPKKVKIGGDSGPGGFLLLSERAAPAPRRPRPRPRPRPALAGAGAEAEAEVDAEVASYFALWESLGARNGRPCYYSDDSDEDRGRAPRRKL